MINTTSSFDQWRRTCAINPVTNVRAVMINTINPDPWNGTPFDQWKKTCTINPSQKDCTGCTDPSSEGTHQTGTKQHPISPKIWAKAFRWLFK